MPRVPLVDEHVAPEVASIAARIRNERGGKLLTLYQVLLGQEKGPRFGSFAALFGPSRTAALIREALTGAFLKG